jgi:predicted chitinase
MAYEIKDGKVVAKATDGQTRRFSKRAIDAIIGECKRRGVTNKYIIAGILATVSKESGFVPQNENLNYSESGLRDTFGSYFGPGKKDARDYAKQPEKIGNYIYGGEYDKKTGVYKLGRGGNTVQGDGFKYRGRGFNQITFKSGYEKKQKYIPGLVNNPELLNDEINAAIACVAFYVDGDFNSKKRIKQKFGLSSVNDFSDWDNALMCIINMTAGFGYSTTNKHVRKNYDKAKKCHGFLIEYLEKNPEGLTAPPGGAPTPEPVADSQTQQQNDIESQDQGSSGDTGSPSNNNSSGAPITNLTQFFKPTIEPTKIQFDSSGINEEEQQYLVKQLGYQPFVFINGVQIKMSDLEKFKLYHKGILPVIETTFFDSFGLLQDEGIPKDDSKISIYLNSRSKNLRSIKMDFKIFNFKEISKGYYTIVGICNIPEIYIRKFASYKSKTSHEALQEVARQCGLGFCSNIQNSDDKMTWLNTGFKNLEFIDNIMLNSYVSDQSFQHCYIDFYYNLCYVDLSKELSRDVSQDKMINAYGYRWLKGKDDEEADEEITEMVLLTDKSMKGDVGYIEKYEITNKSTKVSVKKSYRTKTKYYDSIKKELLIFDVESQTSDGSKSIILKGDPNDSNFFENNTNYFWSGKIDSFDEGQGNVHKNYNYSISQNKQNLDDITKFSGKFYLPNLNYNLYVYQKIPIKFTLDKVNPMVEQYPVKRLTGDWLITGIEFSLVSGKQYQIVTAVLRELSLIKGEESESKSRANKGEDNQKSHTNELSPNDEPASNSEPNAPPNTNSTETPNDAAPYPTAEQGGMVDEIPEAPANPSKSTPSGFQFGGYSKTTSKKTQVVFHYTAGWQLLDRNEATCKTLFSRNVSYHYIIAVDGHIENLVPPEYKAWHATSANDTSIGISLACLGSTSGVEGGKVYKERKGKYKLIENYVDYVDINLNPKTWRSIKRGQEVSEAQLVSLLKLLKYLRQRIPTLPAWEGLTENNFFTVFGSGKEWKKDKPGYYTHGSVTSSKVDAAPTPRFVQFLKTNRW